MELWCSCLLRLSKWAERSVSWREVSCVCFGMFGLLLSDCVIVYPLVYGIHQRLLPTMYLILRICRSLQLYEVGDISSCAQGITISLVLDLFSFLLSMDSEVQKRDNDVYKKMCGDKFPGFGCGFYVLCGCCFICCVAAWIALTLPPSPNAVMMYISLYVSYHLDVTLFFALGF